MKVLSFNADLTIKYDHAAGVFYVHSSNVPGLHAEAEELDDLLIELETMIPELRMYNAHLT